MHQIACNLRQGGATLAALTCIALVALGCGSDEDGENPSKSEQTTGTGAAAAPCDIDARAQESASRLEQADFKVLDVSDDEPGQPEASLAIVLGELEGSVETTLFVFCDAGAASEATKLAEMVVPGKVTSAVARQTSLVLTKAPGGEEGEQVASRIRDEVLEILARRSKFVEACGRAESSGLTLEIDIVEGRLPTTCDQAREVISRYIDAIEGGSSDVDGCCSRQIRAGGVAWDCYKARLDGQGWDYHCNRLAPGGFVDVGAGRRF